MRLDVIGLVTCSKLVTGKVSIGSRGGSCFRGGEPAPVGCCGLVGLGGIIGSGIGVCATGWRSVITCAPVSVFWCRRPQV